MRKIFLSIGLLCLSMSAFAQQQGDPDLILFNGKIFTSVEARPYVEALAIRGERIVATGDTKTIRAMAGPKTNAIDLHGIISRSGRRKSMLICRRQTRRGSRSRMALWLLSQRTLRTASSR